MITTKTIYLDVRTPQEFAEMSIPDSVNIPLNELPKKLNLLSISKKIKVFCAGGARAIVAMEILSRQGFKDVVCLGSFVDAQKDKDLENK